MIAAPNRYAVRPVRSPRDATPHVLLRDGEIVGGVRIDLIGRSRAGLHLVASGAISSGKATTASRPGLRKTPRAFWQNRDHHRCPPTSPLLPRQWLSAGWMGDAGPPPATPFAWESDCR